MLFYIYLHTCTLNEIMSSLCFALCAQFYISYIDYGNKEIASRSDLVELPEDLQTPGLAKKYKFWGFHVSGEEDTPLYLQVFDKCYLFPFVASRCV